MNVTKYEKFFVEKKNIYIYIYEINIYTKLLIKVFIMQITKI